jgi:cation:H+ antiporter
MLLGYYLLYTMHLVLAAAHHDALSSFSAIMLYFVIPLTLITLVVIATRELLKRGARKPD